MSRVEIAQATIELLTERLRSPISFVVDSYGKHGKVVPSELSHTLPPEIVNFWKEVGAPSSTPVFGDNEWCPYLELQFNSRIKLVPIDDADNVHANQLVEIGMSWDGQPIAIVQSRGWEVWVLGEDLSPLQYFGRSPLAAVAALAFVDQVIQEISQLDYSSSEYDFQDSLWMLTGMMRDALLKFDRRLVTKDNHGYWLDAITHFDD